MSRQETREIISEIIEQIERIEAKGKQPSVIYMHPSIIIAISRQYLTAQMHGRGRMFAGIPVKERSSVEKFIME